jgi:hypothetical protein
MSRKYKFRGWYLGDYEIIPKWVYGHYVGGGLPSIIEHHENTDKTFPYTTYIVDPESVGQLVLSFKDGTEIYEGDIVECTYEGDYLESAIAVVQWAGGCYPAYDLDIPSPDETSNAISCFLANGDLKVIGNIYQNKGILNERKTSGGTDL